MFHYIPFCLIGPSLKAVNVLQSWVQSLAPEAPRKGECQRGPRHFWNCRTRLGFGPVTDRPKNGLVSHSYTGGAYNKYRRLRPPRWGMLTWPCIFFVWPRRKFDLCRDPHFKISLCHIFFWFDVSSPYIIQTRVKITTSLPQHDGSTRTGSLMPCIQDKERAHSRFLLYDDYQNNE